MSPPGRGGPPPSRVARARRPRLAGPRALYGPKSSWRRPPAGSAGADTAGSQRGGNGFRRAGAGGGAGLAGGGGGGAVGPRSRGAPRLSAAPRGPRPPPPG